jgi:daunorubicin resistance ABC transporter ATP-binding subunit
VIGGVVVEGLRKRFGTFVALDGIDLVARPGTVAGLLGPNGAGKTTMIRILTTLIEADGGRATVGGYDVFREQHFVRSVISLTGQYAAVDEDLTGRENLTMIGQLCGLSRKRARTRADELLARFSLGAAANKLVRTYSGGMRRRVDLAASLVGRPQVLFLDEPTTGLDPQSRLQLWEVVRNLRDEGTTIVLTTQYLEEADNLADMITVIDHGSIVAEGTAKELKARFGGEVVELTAMDHAVASKGADRIAENLGIPFDYVTFDPDRGHAFIPIPTGSLSVFGAVRLLDAAGLELEDVSLRGSSLDEVFLALTGQGADALDPVDVGSEP